MRQLTRAFALAFAGAAAAAGTAHAQALEAFEARLAVLDQGGRGWQSLDGPADQPGDQAALIVEPIVWARLRQSARTVHEVALEIDVVSAASPDAIDATTSASRINEALTIDVASHLDVDRSTLATIRWGAHVEEPMRSGWLGLGYTRKLADDNFTIAASAMYGFDNFDAYKPDGRRPGLTQRQRGAFNLSVSQVLSPTTVLDAAWGTTLQWGTLETTWNAARIVDNPDAYEVFPDHRLRHAATVRVSQHVPRTRSTLKASGRAYADSFGLDAYTLQLFGYQYLTRWLVARVGFRHHQQDGVDFYADVHAQGAQPRTSDSDLAPLASREWTAQVRLLGDRGPWRRLARTRLEATAGRYRRDNDLTIYWGALGVGYTF